MSVSKKTDYICSMKNSPVKQRIIETASHLFYQRGYNLTGINEIIKEANIAKATLYNHFKSKEDICLAYLKFKDSTLQQELRMAIEKAPQGKKRLLTFFDFLKAFFEDKDFNGCWCLNTISELPKENQKIRTTIQQQKQGLLQLIQRITTENLPHKSAKDQQAIAKQIYLLYESALSESYLHQDAWPIESARKLCAAIIE